MFQDEAIFGRIGKAYKCWALTALRPMVYQHKIREYRYLFGAVDPFSGDSCFRITTHCDTLCMNYYLQELSEQYADSYILLVCDNAGWHKSKTLVVPHNIEIIHIPPYTPEMNPAEQIWDEIREKHFANKLFKSINHVIDNLCFAVNALTNDTIRSISSRKWVGEQLI
jgi:putative transposase